MLFKTKNPIRNNGYSYFELPQKFNFEITKRAEFFLDKGTTNYTNNPLPKDVKEQVGEEYVPAGIKRLFFYTEDGEFKNIFFSGKGFIIGKNNQTIETL